MKFLTVEAFKGGRTEEGNGREERGIISERKKYE